MIKAAFNSSPSNGSTPSNGNTPAIGNTPSPAAEQKMYGYIRVSTREQNEARQLIALHDFGIPEECVFMDKQSGKDFQRPAYQALLAQLSPGDVLVVKSIDRLGRHYNEILEQWRLITKERQAAIVVLDMPLLDTRNSRDLTGTLIADIVLQLLSYVAETERAFIRQRQAEGIAAAKARGTHFGPKPRDRGPLYPSVKAQWERQEISATEAGKILGCTHNTFLKWVRSDSSSDPSILS
jgi:DNA invertase Pin-like site-specific DNA recombinase